MPSDAEWTVLTNYLTNNGYGYEGSGIDIGKSMASTVGWNYTSTAGYIGNDQASNNGSGFTALPAGDRNGGFGYLGIYAYFWSSSEIETGAWMRCLNYDSGGMSRDRYYDGRSLGFSVRCLKD